MRSQIDINKEIYLSTLYELHSSSESQNIIHCYFYSKTDHAIYFYQKNISTRNNEKVETMYFRKLNLSQGFYKKYNDTDVVTLSTHYGLNYTVAMSDNGKNLYTSKMNSDNSLDIFYYIHDKKDQFKNQEQIIHTERFNKEISDYAVTLGDIDHKNEWMLISAPFVNTTLDLAVIYRHNKKHDETFLFPSIINTEDRDEYSGFITFEKGLEILYYTRKENEHIAFLHKAMKNKNSDIWDKSDILPKEINKFKRNEHFIILNDTFALYVGTNQYFSKLMLVSSKPIVKNFEINDLELKRSLVEVENQLAAEAIKIIVVERNSEEAKAIKERIKKNKNKTYENESFTGINTNNPNSINSQNPNNLTQATSNNPSSVNLLGPNNIAQSQATANNPNSTSSNSNNGGTKLPNQNIAVSDLANTNIINSNLAKPDISNNSTSSNLQNDIKKQNETVFFEDGGYNLSAKDEQKVYFFFKKLMKQGNYSEITLKINNKNIKNNEFAYRRAWEIKKTLVRMGANQNKVNIYFNTKTTSNTISVELLSK